MRVSVRAPRPLRKTWTTFGWLATVGVVAAACNTQTDNGEACFPGDFQVITLPNGATEYLKCGSDGGGYGAYDGPDPNALPDANEPEGGTIACSADGGKLGFMCPGCSTSADCEPGLGLVCFSFPNKGGNLCTLPCPQNACPAPSAGCGNNGHCKP